MLVATLRDHCSSIIEQITALAIVVPDGTAASEGEAAGFGMVLVGAYAAALNEGKM